MGPRGLRPRERYTGTMDVVPDGDSYLMDGWNDSASKLLVTRRSRRAASAAPLRLVCMFLVCCALLPAGVACAGSDPARQPRQAESGTAGPAVGNPKATQPTPQRAPPRTRPLRAVPPIRLPARRPLRQRPSAQPAPVPSGPLVLLVHGYGGSPDELIPLARRLERAGYATVRVALPEHGLADIRASAAAVNAAVAAAGRTTALSAVGYSLGGVVLRLWLQEQGVGLQHLVMLSTPNAGVAVTAGPFTYPETECLPNNACGQLQPGSELLGQLLPTPPHLSIGPRRPSLVERPAGASEQRIRPSGGDRHTAAERVRRLPRRPR